MTDDPKPEEPDAEPPGGDTTGATPGGGATGAEPGRSAIPPVSRTPSSVSSTVFSHLRPSPTVAVIRCLPFVL